MNPEIIAKRGPVEKLPSTGATVPIFTGLVSLVLKEPLLAFIAQQVFLFVELYLVFTLL
jgi:hypothetical protein